MSQVFTVIFALIVLSIFVFLHELGHFGMGRLLGFKIMEFAIGMGPIVAKKEKNGTVYALRAFPVGGMCRFYGEDEVIRDSDSFNSHKVWKRFLVVLAGPLMNILFAIIFAMLTLWIYGDIVPQITSFAEDRSPAKEAGIEEGDYIYAINGKQVEYYAAVVDMIRSAQGSDITMTVERSGKKIDFLLRNVYHTELGYNYIGITMQPARMQYGFFPAIGSSIKFVASVIREMLAFLGGIFTKGIQQGDVIGPIGTIDVVGQAVRMGFESVLRLAVLISVNLGLINLLPLPALDGGRLMFMAVEGVRGKPVPAKIEGTIHFIGIVLLLGLMVLLTFNDIINLFGG